MRPLLERSAGLQAQENARAYVFPHDEIVIEALREDC